MSFAAPTGNRFLFFTVLPFALFAIAVVTLPFPAHQPARGVVMALDAVLVLCLWGLWPYHRPWRLHRSLAGVAAVFLGFTCVARVAMSASDLPRRAGASELLLTINVGFLAYLAGYFALQGRPKWVGDRWWPVAEVLAARDAARASWQRFVERYPAARVSLVQFRLHAPEHEGVPGTPALLSQAAHPDVIELDRVGGDGPWDVVALAVWGEVLEVGPERLRVRPRLPLPLPFDVPPTCDVDPRQVCDWELEMPDGSVEGAFGLCARADYARRHGIRLTWDVRERRRRWRQSPEAASTPIPAAAKRPRAT